MSKEQLVRDNLGGALGSETVLTVGVLGNPNSGKSTLINAISGSRLKVGNWPGVTVEKKEALLKHSGKSIRLVDLPGTYSLKPFSEDEEVVLKFLLETDVDIIINVIDATNLERSLYLTIQLMELGYPIIIALNMMDEVREKGISFDISKMEKLLSVKVVPTVSHKGENVSLLLDSLVDISDDERANLPNDLSYGEDLEEARSSIEGLLNSSSEYKGFIDNFPKKWLIYKLIEEDKFVKALSLKLSSFLDDILSHLKTGHNKDTASIVSDIRHGIASGISHKVTSQKKMSRLEFTERVDRVLLSRGAGGIIFAFVMFLLFQLTFGFANPFIDWIDGPVKGFFMSSSLKIMNYLDLSPWLKSLFLEGVVGGVGTVLVFTPLIFFMMFFMTFLEGSGYMARAAFIMDKLMQSIGVQGKSFIPMLLGFGCNVGGVYATRTLESKSDKIITSMAMPFMSCSARLPVYGVIASIFFASYLGLITFLMYLIGILVGMLVIFVLRRSLFKDESSFFIMELPPYRFPTFKYLFIHAWHKARYFVVQAGTWILAAMILVWVLNNVPWSASQEDKRDSLLGIIGTGLSYVAIPLGFGERPGGLELNSADEGKVIHWEAGAALLTGIVAKELVIGSLGQLYGSSEEDIDLNKPTLDYLYDAGTSFLDTIYLVSKNFVTLGFYSEEGEDGSIAYRDKLRSYFTPLSSFVYMLFTLLYMPCVVTAIAYKNELGSWKWFYFSALASFGIAYTLSFLTYQLGSLF